MIDCLNGRAKGEVRLDESLPRVGGGERERDRARERYPVPPATLFWSSNQEVESQRQVVELRKQGRHVLLGNV